jgi:hypothetical protein
MVEIRLDVSIVVDGKDARPLVDVIEHVTQKFHEEKWHIIVIGSLRPTV